MEDFEIINFDKNNIRHHIRPSDLILPKTWSEEYTLPNFTNGIEGVLSKVDIPQFFLSIAQSLKCVAINANGNTSENPPVINTYFDFNDCVRKILYQSTVVIFHLNLCSTRDDWYEEMVDFIEYNGHTFGMPSTGYRQYLEAVQYLIERHDPNPKLTKLSEYIQLELSNENKKSAKNNLPSLLEMFNEWWKSIPFNLEYFKPFEKGKNELKALLFAIGPKGDFQVNRYSDVLKTSVYSPTELSEALCVLTEVICKELNVLTFYENHQLTNPQKVKLQLLLAHRRKQLELDYLSDNSSLTPGYQKFWRRWLEDEKSFFAELEPLISKVPPNFTSKTKEIIQALNQFEFEKFLKKNGFRIEEIYKLLELHGRDLPYCIALLYEVGYLKYHLDEFCHTKKGMHQNLAKIFGADERRIRGNVNIISNSGSTEDPTQYTSITYQEMVRKQIEGLK
jgi:hypothetical protein